jgi:hypothetical protein
MWLNTENVAFICPSKPGEWNVTMNNNLTFTIGEADAGRLFSEITVRPRD